MYFQEDYVKVAEIKFKLIKGISVQYSTTTFAAFVHTCPNAEKNTSLKHYSRHSMTNSRGQQLIQINRFVTNWKTGISPENIITMNTVRRNQFELSKDTSSDDEIKSQWLDILLRQRGQPPFRPSYIATQTHHTFSRPMLMLLTNTAKKQTVISSMLLSQHTVYGNGNIGEIFLWK